MKEKYYNGKTLYFVFKSWSFDNVDHLFSSRLGWKNENELINNIFATNKDIVSLKQVHGNHVEIVDEDFLEVYKNDKVFEGDGLITNIESVILKTYHADCTPLYFVDNIKGVVGVAHAGWKGTYKNILKEMICNMVETYESNIKDIHLYIGPAIKSCCYEVGKDLYDDFLVEYGKYSQAFDVRDGRYYIDTQMINYCHAKNLSVIDENITISNLCTACNVDKLYSYRKENGTKGRLVTAITINK